MLVNTMADWMEFARHIRKYDEIVIDTETTGLFAYGGDELIGIAIDCGDRSFYLPFRHVSGNLPEDYLTEELPALLAHVHTFIGHNTKFDIHFLAQEGIPMPPYIEDTMVGAHLFNENEKSFTLEDLADRHIPREDGFSHHHNEEIMMLEIYALGIRKSKAAKAQMWRLAPERVAPYAENDVILTRRLREFYMDRLVEWEKLGGGTLLDLYHDVNYYQLILAYMERRGLLLDVEKVRENSARAIRYRAEMQHTINNAAGKEINLNSWQQICKLLNIKSSKREVLELMTDNDIAQAILDYRSWNKMLTSYYNPYLEYMDSDHVLHPNLKTTGTVSSRLSSSNPNMQAVPRLSDEEDGSARVKEVFRARDGYVLMEADYSQAELRLVSHYAEKYCEDSSMSDIIRSGEKLHQATADRLKIPYDYAKRINFGVVYGIGAPGLSRHLEISEQEASGYLQQYRKLYPGIRDFYRMAEKRAVDDGYIVMWTGRYRHYGKTIPTHKAMSNLIQGGVAEIMRVTMTRLFEEFMDYDVYMLLQVHDSILFEVRDDIKQWAHARIKFTMEDLPQFLVPPEVEIKMSKEGGRWSEIKDTPSEWVDDVERLKRA